MILNEIYNEIDLLSEYMKIYVQFLSKKSSANKPTFEEYRKKEKVDYIPITAGINISWSKYGFSICDSNEYFPRGKKEGKHIFSLTIGILYWAIRFTLYTPGKFGIGSNTNNI